MNKPEEYGSTDLLSESEATEQRQMDVTNFTDGQPNWLQIARDAFETSTTYLDANIRKQVEKNIALAQSRHPAGSKYHQSAYAYRSKVFRPKTRTVLRRHEAAAVLAFFSTQNLVSCDPEDPSDPTAAFGAKFGKKWLEFRLEHSIPWFKTLVGAYQDAMIQGIVISRQEWLFKTRDNFVDQPVIGEDGMEVIDENGEPAVDRINDPEIIIDKPDISLIPLENFRFSTAADWRDPVKTSPFLIEIIPMFVGDVLERMEEGNDKTGEHKWKKISDDVILTAVRSGDSDTTRTAREGKRADSKDESYQLKHFDIVWVHRNIVRHKGEDYIYYSLGTTNILSDPKPVEDVYLHGRPYVIGSSIIETHKNYPAGIPELLQDLQTEANDLANQRLDNIKLILNKRYRAKRGSSVDWSALKTSVPGGIVLMDDLRDVEEEKFSDVTGSAYAEQDRVNVDFDELAGNFSTGSVQTNRSLNETVGGMAMALDDSNVITEYQIKVFAETWVEPVLRQLLEMGRKYETSKNILSIVGNNADPQQVLDAMKRPYNVRMSVGFGSTSPQKKVEKMRMGLATIGQFMPQKMAKVNSNEVIAEIFGALGYADGKRFFFEEDKKNPQVAQLEEQIQQLTQQLKTKQLDNQTKVQVAQVREQGQTQREQMRLQQARELAQLDIRIKYIKEQVAAEKNDISRGELILEQEALEFQKRQKEIDYLTNDNDHLSQVLMNDRYGMVPAAEG